MKDIATSKDIVDGGWSEIALAQRQRQRVDWRVTTPERRF
jgi:hypothetical protein